MVKTNYYYVNAKYNSILRYRISKGYYYLLCARSLKNNFPHLISQPCDNSRIYKDYFALDNDFFIYVECERRYLGYGN